MTERAQRVPSNTTRAVVLARGLGTRMRAPDPGARLSDEQRRAADAGSKAMIPVHGRPFLDYVLGALADAGIAGVALVVAPDHDEIRRYYAEHPPERVALSFVVQAEAFGTANAVLAVEQWTGGAPFLAMNADNLYPVPALQALAALDEPGLPAFDRDDLVRSSNIPAERVLAFALVEVDDQGYLIGIVEKPKDLPPKGGSHSEGSHSEGSHSEGSHSEGSRSEGSHSEGSHSEGSRSEGSRSGGSRSEESRSEESRSEESHSEESCSEESCSEESCSEESRSEESRSEESCSEGSHSEESHSEGSVASAFRRKILLSRKVSMNCWRFDARIFDACRDVPRSARGEFELPEAVALATHRGVRFKAIPALGPVLDLSRRADAADVERRLAGRAPRL